MTVSDRDRAYFRRIGDLKADSHADASSKHLQQTMAERLRRSWLLYEAHCQTRERAALDRDDDDPSPFYARARALGLYRP